MRNLRELERQHRAYEKAEAAERAATEAATFENYLKRLVTVHKDCGLQWDWASYVQAPIPPLPAMKTEREVEARRNLEAYRPRFFEKLFGAEKKQRAHLEHRLVEARRQDAAVYVDAVNAHKTAFSKWQALRDLGLGVVARDLSAFRKALEYVDPFSELDDYDTTVSIVDLVPGAIVLFCEITDAEVVPKEEVKLTAAGRLSTKQMAASRYWDLYQDYVCSCAIRVARETLSILPVARTVVSVGARTLNTSTGHPEAVTFLTVSILREALQRLNLSAIDPSDAMKNFPHRMRFKKTAGFEAVEPISLEENLVTAG